MRIAINGFGRVGRQFFKAAFGKPKIDIVAVNDLADIQNIAYLLEYDTVYGHYDKKIETGGNNLIIDGKTIKYFSESDPLKLPWKDLNIDIVVESTGRFTSYEKAKAHLLAGAKRVVISAPAKDEETPTFIPNVNELAASRLKITSNASCTTNAAAIVAAIMIKNPGIKYSVLNTVHGATAEQSLIDSPMPSLHKDFRRGRSAIGNIVPTSTGAAKAAAKTIPELKDKFDGIALRVPILAGSILDFTFSAKKKTSVEEINNIFIEEAKKPEWKGILDTTDQPIVSSDILKNPHGAIVDLKLTRVVDGELIKVMAWYDNEWGYAEMLLRHILSLEKFL